MFVGRWEFWGFVFFLGGKSIGLVSLLGQKGRPSFKCPIIIILVFTGVTLKISKKASAMWAAQPTAYCSTSNVAGTTSRDEGWPCSGSPRCPRVKFLCTRRWLSRRSRTIPSYHMHRAKKQLRKKARKWTGSDFSLDMGISFGASWCGPRDDFRFCDLIYECVPSKFLLASSDCETVWRDRGLDHPIRIGRWSLQNKYHKMLQNSLVLSVAYLLWWQWQKSNERVMISTFPHDKPIPTDYD